jgi:hypothetical protein
MAKKLHVETTTFLISLHISIYINDKSNYKARTLKEEQKILNVKVFFIKSVKTEN